jgi:hypothetical protein
MPLDRMMIQFALTDKLDPKVTCTSNLGLIALAARMK